MKELRNPKDLTIHDVQPISDGISDQPVTAPERRDNIFKDCKDVVMKATA